MEYTIKEVTKKYNLSASTLRYYEKEGLLPKIKKNQSNQRVYDDDDLSWLDIIMCMRKTGMTIAYIKNYIELCQEGDNTINQRYEIFLKQKEILLLQQQELEKNIETVNYKINLYKEKYGLIAIGGWDSFGKGNQADSTEEEVRDSVRLAMDTYGPGGRYIFWESGITPRFQEQGEYLADEARKYGSSFYQKR